MCVGSFVWAKGPKIMPNTSAFAASNVKLHALHFICFYKIVLVNAEPRRFYLFGHLRPIFC